MSFWESSGLSSLPYLFGKKLRRGEAAPKLSDLIQQLSKLKAKDKIDFSIEYLLKINDHEHDRIKTVDSKAFTLLSATGISASFTIGFLSLLLDWVDLQVIYLAIAAGGAFFFVITSFVIAALFAGKSLKVARFVFLSPDDALKLPKTKLVEAQIEYIASLYYAIINNRAITNRKTSYLIFSQQWFRNSIVFLLFASILLAGSFILAKNPVTTPSLTATVTTEATNTSVVVETPISGHSNSTEEYNPLPNEDDEAVTPSP